MARRWGDVGPVLVRTWMGICNFPFSKGSLPLEMGMLILSECTVVVWYNVCLFPNNHVIKFYPRRSPSLYPLKAEGH